MHDHDDEDDAAPVWRRVDRKDVPALVLEWVGIGLASVLDARAWTAAERAEITHRLTPLLRAFYVGHFSALVGPPTHTDDTPTRLH